MNADTSGGGVRKMKYFMRTSQWEAATIKYGEKEESELEWDRELLKERWRETERKKNEKSDGENKRGRYGSKGGESRSRLGC